MISKNIKRFLYEWSWAIAYMLVAMGVLVGIIYCLRMLSEGYFEQIHY